MRAVIVRHKRGRSYVLDGDGFFRFVKGHGSKPVGTEIEVRRDATPAWQSYSTAAYCLAFLLFIGSFAWLWNAKSYTMYIDINPSVELEFNCFDRLVGANGLNPEASAMLDGLELSGSPAEVVSSLVQAAGVQGYLSQAGDLPSVLVTVFARSDSASLTHMFAISQSVDKTGLGGITTVSTCSQDTLDLAQRLGISPGKLNLVQQLLEADPSLSFDDLVNLSVDDLMGEIKRAEEQADDPADQPEGPDGGSSKGALPIISKTPAGD
jgi:hypothetical protein